MTFSSPVWLSLDSPLRPYGPDLARWHLVPSWVGHGSSSLNLDIKLPERLPSRLQDHILASCAFVEQKRQRKWDWTYPELPILAIKEIFLETLQKEQVVLVCAGTGSGKSTQIPKFCLEAGFASAGRIGMTQPRRIAATSIANRISEEIALPHVIGCQTRYYKSMPPGADIKVMTEGILLQEMRKDPWLWDYSVIILDEVHERSLQVDFLLGLLKLCLKHRPDLKLVLSSATLDASSLQNFFPQAKLIEADGRTYPVETLFLEDTTPDDFSLAEKTADAILAILQSKPDNLLAFLPTERDIIELQKELENQLSSSTYTVLPLYGRLSPAEQSRVFLPSDKLKVVLATNVAETSLTIPGIGIVVDTGLCRISRYQPQNRIQGLPIEPISQASARQRAGRAGRTKPGLCLCLYSKSDLENRPAFTDPEIKRSNLANVTLQLLAMGIEHLTEFDLPDNPTPAQYRNSIRLLFDLEAVDRDELHTSLTPLGRKLATVPLDVTLARMLLEGRKLRVLPTLLPLVAAVSVQDPRIFPSDPLEKSRAQGLHSRFTHKKSDALQMYTLFRWIKENWEGKNSQKSKNRLRRLCVENWLHFPHTQEWIELWEQMRRDWQIPDLPLPPVEKLDEDAIHRSLLSGLPGMVACNDLENKCYRLPGGKESYIFPGSCLKKQFPPWVACFGIRATSRTFLSGVFEIQPQWIEELWPHRCKRMYGQPEYEPSRGYVSCRETIQYQGLSLPQSKRVSMERIDPAGASRVFWQDAMENEQIRVLPEFHKKNKATLEKMRQRANRIPVALGLPQIEQLTEWYIATFPQINSDLSLNEQILAKGEISLHFPFEEELKQALERFCEGAPPQTLPVMETWDRLFPAQVYWKVGSEPENSAGTHTLLIHYPKDKQNTWELEIRKPWLLWHINYAWILVQIPGLLYIWAHYFRSAGWGFPFPHLHAAVQQIQNELQSLLPDKAGPKNSSSSILIENRFQVKSVLNCLFQVLKANNFTLPSDGKYTWAQLSMGLPDFRLNAPGAAQKPLLRVLSPLMVPGSALSWANEEKPKVPPLRPGPDWQACILPAAPECFAVLGWGTVKYHKDPFNAFVYIWQNVCVYEPRGKQKWKEDPLWKNNLRPLWESVPGIHREMLLYALVEIATQPEKRPAQLPPLASLFQGRQALGAWSSLWGPEVFWALAQAQLQPQQNALLKGLEPKNTQAASALDWIIATWAALRTLHIPVEKLSPVGAAWAELWASHPGANSLASQNPHVNKAPGIANSSPTGKNALETKGVNISTIYQSEAWKKLREHDPHFEEQMEKKAKSVLDSTQISLDEKMSLVVEMQERLRRTVHLKLLDNLKAPAPSLTDAPAEWHKSQVNQLKQKFGSL